MPGGLKLYMNEKCVCITVLGELNFFKMINLFTIFALRMVSSCSLDPEDAEVGELLDPHHCILSDALSTGHFTCWGPGVGFQY